MTGSLRAKVKRMFFKAFAPPRPRLTAFYYGVIDTLISPLDTFIAVDQTRKDGQLEDLNALLNEQSELEGPKVAEEWRKIYHDAKWIFEGCFIIVECERLYHAKDIRLFDLSRLYFKYPEIENVGSAEVDVLLRYTNAMVAAYQLRGPVQKKGMLIDICARISEDASAAGKYKRGSGPQTIESSLREIIYENECAIEPKLCQELREALVERLASLSTAGVAGKHAPLKKIPLNAKQPARVQPESSSEFRGANVQQTPQMQTPGDGGFAGKVQPSMPPVIAEELMAVFLAFRGKGAGGDAEEWRTLAAAGPWLAGDLGPEPVCRGVNSDAHRAAAVDCYAWGDENRGHCGTVLYHPSQRAMALFQQTRGWEL
jgi:hypothetical protein